MVVDLATAGGNDDGKDTDSLTRNLSFSKFDRPEQFDKPINHQSVEDSDSKKETAGTLTQSKNVERVQMSDGSSDKDSLSRGSSFTNFKSLIEYADPIGRSEIPVYPEIQKETESPGNIDTVDYESFPMKQLGTTEHSDKRPWKTLKTKREPEIQGHADTEEQLQTTEEPYYSTVDEANQMRGLSFSTFDKLIDYASTINHSKIPEHPIIQEHPEIQPNPQTMDFTMEAPIGNYREESETSEYAEVHLAFADDREILIKEDGGKVENALAVHTSDDTEHIYSLPFRGKRHKQKRFVTDTVDVTTSHEESEKLGYDQNEANSNHSSDSDETAVGLTFVRMNDNYLEAAAQPVSASPQTTSKDVEIKRHSNTYDTGDAADSLGIISFGSHQNDSTHIVETKGKTAQWLEFDETSNFEFVKIVKK